MSIDVVINNTKFTTAIVDNGCCTYAVVSEKLVRELDLPRIPISLVKIKGVNKQTCPVRTIT